MALIGEMQYLTIGGSTYSIPTGTIVEVERNLTSGTKSATIKVDGTSYDLYAPTPNAGTVTSVRVQATSPVQSSTSTAQSSSLNTTISLANGYGDTKNPYGTKTKNYVLAGPTTGSDAAPTFRALVAADIPDLSGTYLTSYTETDPVYSASVAAGITATDISNWNAKADSDVNVTNTAVTAATTYYLTGSTSSSTATGGLSKHAAIKAYVTANSGTGGSARIDLGNTTATTSAGGKEGIIRLYGTSATYYVDLKAGAPGANRTITFPNKTGTVALTDDIPTVSYPVTSVNSKTGAVSLTASDVGALASSTTYVSTITTSAGTHSTISSKSGAVSFNVPTKTSHLTNDSGYVTSSGVTSVATGAGLTGGTITGTGTLKANLTSDTALSNAALSVTEDANRIYPVRIDKNSKLVVVVPWTNVNSSYLTGITSSQVTTALGFTPYNATNPNGYTSNTGTITSVKTTAGKHTTINTLSGAVSFNVPTNTSHLTNDSGFVTSSGVTSITPGNGLISGTSGSSQTAITGTGTISMATITRTNNTSTASPAHSGTFTAIDSITTDNYGRVTAVNTKTITLPASGNTDTKVSTAAIAKTTTYYPVLGTNTTNAETKYYDATNLTYYTYSSGNASLRVGSSSNAGNLTLGGSGTQGNITLYNGTEYYGNITMLPGSTDNHAYWLPDKGGTIALTTDTVSKISTIVTLAASDWDENIQTITVEGVETTSDIIVMPVDQDAGIIATEQDVDSITFECDSVPSNDVQVQLLIFT